MSSSLHSVTLAIDAMTSSSPTTPTASTIISRATSFTSPRCLDFLRDASKAISAAFCSG
eukprot:CAMPEP_0185754232 /NCGR_PEP_ID=MMETSP1174-20130828/12874_1 /TAXON_ID=35687 /ORGANISM="Dictyocha speculum, Strain CCMP1381" /LENGTH=58 /DNA_ID=CAMNT_0028432355 /DNA_START=166 /DNA_END=338 /DNA_ORIENTATION=-